MLNLFKKVLGSKKSTGVALLPLYFTFLSLIIPMFLYTIDEYPEWFLYPKLNSEIVIGFSYKKTPAIVDARRMHCVYKKNDVYGYLETMRLSGERYYVKSDYYYYFDHSCYEKTSTDSLFLLDGFGVSVMSMDYVQAFSFNKQASVSKETAVIANIPSPNWINKDVWSEDDYFYGVGMFTSSGNKNDAWKTSEEKAIYNILTSNSIKIFSLKYLKYKNSEIQKNTNINYNRIELNYHLTNIETLERWPHEDGYFYTLVRIDQEDITLNE
jgi:hypothetical protein